MPISPRNLVTESWELLYELLDELTTKLQSSDMQEPGKKLMILGQRFNLLSGSVLWLNSDPLNILQTILQTSSIPGRY